MNDISLLVEKLGEEKTEELMKLVKNFDTYQTRFKNKVNEIVNPINHEIKVAAAFMEKEKDNK